MPTEAKRETVEELRAELADSSTLVVSEYRGLTVTELAEIRRALRRQDVRYRVVKNRLLKIAARDSDAEALAPMLEGPTAIAFGKGDPAQTAKAVLDAMRPYRVVRITGALLGNRAIDADGVTKLAALPSREVLLARLAGAMQAPVANLGGLLSANLRNLGSMLAQLRERKAASEPRTVTEPERAAGPAPAERKAAVETGAAKAEPVVEPEAAVVSEGAAPEPAPEPEARAAPSTEAGEAAPADSIETAGPAEAPELAEEPKA